MVLIKNRLGQFYFEGDVQKVRHHHSSHATKKKQQILLIFFPFYQNLYSVLYYLLNTLGLCRETIENFIKFSKHPSKDHRNSGRRVTWLENIPSSVNDLLATIAVVEYIGTFLERKYHGNTKQKDANQ